MSRPDMVKAVILARGLGTRMKKDNDAAKMSDEQSKIADTGVKAMIPIDRPFLDYSMHNLAEAGYKEVCLVIGPEHDAVRNYYQNEVGLLRLKISFGVQEQPLGTANAVLAARGFTGNDDFIVINSDNFYPIDALKGLRELDGPGLAGFERESLVEQSNIPADRVSSFAVITANADGFMTKIIEKPDKQTLASIPSPQYLSMNCWRFGPEIYTACDNVPLSPRGELELPDAVQYTINKLDQRYKTVNVRGAVLDLSSREDILAVVDRLKGMEVVI